jgi:hypothetical protein
MATKYVPVGTSATIVHQLAPGESGRIHCPRQSGVVVYLSNNASVTTTTGFPLGPSSSIEWRNGPGAVYGITASGACTLVVDSAVSSSSGSPVF